VDTRSAILAIEISNPSAGGGAAGAGSGVAVGRMGPSGVDVLGVEPVRPTGRGGLDDDLMPAIDRLCKRAGLDPRSGELARVAVSIGPGGYTSLRVACAAGKMIAAACGAKCVGVPTAMVVLHGLSESASSGGVAVALASKSDSAWVQAFNAGRETGPGRLLTALDIPALASAGTRTLIADRFLPAPMRDEAERAGISIIEPTFDAAACLRLGATLPAIDPIELVPLYPREPDAVTLWRARKV
jgi:tRNA threonylcarbamoyladenosine biosynthesis protein TsaB